MGLLGWRRVGGVAGRRGLGIANPGRNGEDQGGVTQGAVGEACARKQPEGWGEGLHHRLLGRNWKKGGGIGRR